MSEEKINRLYDQYVAAFRSGEVDPIPFVDQLEGTDRAELETMIEIFLDRVPPREFNEAEYRKSFSAKMAAEVTDSLSGASGQLIYLLPQLRLERKILVEDVESQLAAALGANHPDEVGKVREYYHELEFGTLPAEPVSDRVFEALAKIFKTSVEALRAAGRALGPDPEHRGGPVYARVAGVGPPPGQASPGVASPGSFKQSMPHDAVDEMADEAQPRQSRSVRARKRDWIDDLFLGKAQY